MTAFSLIFAGTPTIAVPALKAICGSSFQVASVLTNPPAARGRHKALVPSAVAECALSLGVPVIESAKITDGVIESVRKTGAQLLVTFSYGAIFPEAFLKLFPLGGINCHPSLLPKYRGATPIQEAILRRDVETGITIQCLDKRLDAGNIILQEKTRLTGEETTLSLSAFFAEAGARLLVDTLKLFEKGGVPSIVQNENEATFCGKIKKEDGIVDWSLSAAEIDAKIRAFVPWPICRTRLKDKTLLLLESRVAESAIADTTAPPGTILSADKKDGLLVNTGSGAVRITVLQWEGKKALSAGDFLNGAGSVVGCRLSVD